MPDQFLPQVPEAKTVPKRRLRLPLVWIIPLVSAVAGLWIAVNEILNKGPEVTITFASADGIEAHKTKVNYNGLHIGTINSVQLAEDHKHVVAIARIQPTAKELMVKDTKFWVVKARVSGMNITGLSTLISGDYISMQRGQSLEPERSFRALDAPPLTPDVKGKVFTLKSSRLGSLGEGTPVMFRQLQAGQVVAYELDKGGEFLNVKVFIQAPYDHFVTADTRFWQASGVDLSLTASGLRVQTESLMSILAGGIAFETPTGDLPLPSSDDGTRFTLFNDHAEAFKPQVGDPHLYTFNFKQSIRGLAVGAAVEFGGIPIGEVTHITPLMDVKTGDLKVSVTAHLSPEKYGVQFVKGSTTQDSLVNHKLVMDALVGRGMRAQLKTGNLLTGALFVSVDFLTNEPPVTIDWSKTPVELPVAKVTGESLEEMVKNLMKNLDSTVANARGTLSNVDLVTGEFKQTLANASGTLTNASVLLANANKMIEPNSPLNTELNTLLLQGGDAARALRVLADYLERHPEALIRGKTGQAK